MLSAAEMGDPEDPVSDQHLKSDRLWPELLTWNTQKAEVAVQESLCIERYMNVSEAVLGYLDPARENWNWWSVQQR